MPLRTHNAFLGDPRSLNDRLHLGKAVRQSAERSTLGNYRVTLKRSTGLDILRTQEQSRNQSLVPIRHDRMKASPFAFFRGGAAIMAHDLASTPSPAITVQLCGDMHVCNFGFFASTEHHLVFGINDFDETLPGNFDWDIKRLVASAAIASEALGQDDVYAEDIVRKIVTAYRRCMRRFSTTGYVELAHTYINETSLLDPSNHLSDSSRKFLKHQIHQAKENTTVACQDKLTCVADGTRRFRDDPPLVTHSATTYQGDIAIDMIDQALASYAQSLLSDRRHILRRYRLVDCARKIVGIGSVGTGCWVALLEGLNECDPLILQYKQANPSVLAPYFPTPAYRSQGERVVLGQRLLQGAPDYFLGHGQIKLADFYIRQLRDMKGGMTIGDAGISAREFPDYARLFGWTLALAHARSGDPAVLAGYCGKSERLDDAMVRFAFAYRDQNAADYAAFCKALRQGQLASTPKG